jgi:hypothetical protein
MERETIERDMKNIGPTKFFSNPSDSSFPNLIIK